MDFNLIQNLALSFWALLGFVFTLAPARSVQVLTNRRVVLPNFGIEDLRLLGLLNAIGALHLLWSRNW